MICPKLLSLIHGRLLTPMHYHTHKRANFVCSTGYRLVGYQFSECLENGSWSHPVPQCVPIDENGKYRKIFLKRPLKKGQKIGFQDRLSLNAGQKYCRILQESILQYFRPSLSYHLSLRSLFCLFLVAVLDRFYCSS